MGITFKINRNKYTSYWYTPINGYIPFILIYNPALILMGEPLEIILAAVTAIIGVFALSIDIPQLHAVLRRSSRCIDRLSPVQSSLVYVGND